MRTLFLCLRRILLKFRYRNQSLLLGKNVVIVNSRLEQHIYIADTCRIYGSQIGNHTYFNVNCNIRNAIIGKFCSVGSNVQIGMAKHPTDMVSTHPAFYSNDKYFKTFSDKNYFREYDPVSAYIGNDVWIGSDVKILKQVSIGNGAIVAAGSIVTNDVPPYSIVGGIPARVLKYRFSPEYISALEKIQWWDREEEWLSVNFRLFHNVDDFLSKNVY